MLNVDIQSVKVSIFVTQEVETIVKALVTTPDTRGPIHMVVGITQESPERPAQSRECSVAGGEFWIFLS